MHLHDERSFDIIGFRKQPFARFGRESNMFDFWLSDAQRLAFELEWQRMEEEWERRDMEKRRRQDEAVREEEKSA